MIHSRSNVRTPYNGVSLELFDFIRCLYEFITEKSAKYFALSQPICRMFKSYNVATQITTDNVKSPTLKKTHVTQTIINI